MQEIMYDISSITIAVGLFVSLAVIIELGYRIGIRAHEKASEPAKNHTGAIQGSLLGILALLLGFTFSLSLGRHDSRSEAVVNESNAIGTTWLRSQLLDEPVRSQVQALLRAYVDLRVDGGAVSLVKVEKRHEIIVRTGAMHNDLWVLAREAATANPNPVTTGLFIQALNEMIDSFGSRDAALNRHVPELVLFLLYATFLMTGCVIGFTAGLSGHRTSFVTYAMVGLIVVLVFIIIDLDRPRRGLIRISQESIIELQKSIAASADR
jgi:hypothetical protein